MNNKGQALVLVILLIPIIMIVFAGAIESASITYQKNHITSNIKTILTSCLDKCSDEDIKNLLKKNNINYDKLQITRNNNLQVHVKTKIDSIIREDYFLDFTYEAIRNNDEIEIKRVS